MTSSDDDSNASQPNQNRRNNSNSTPHAVIEDPDENTMRILVSTDNHLGYAEGDPVRGNDSFAALEEVLYLAKYYAADMVLLAGDLFHHNKPSRRTLHRTMELLTRYCLGNDGTGIQIQVVSDPSQAFRKGMVNYEHPSYAIAMPIFSIHGNHDDPTREGGTELYSALDMLDCANLVNYIGRQDDVKEVEIAPILLKKGITRLALYGLGNLRDERLNRMWRNHHVTFLKPEGSSHDEDDEGEDGAADDKIWFNLFALHQNRDLGRGPKNCVQESMIPEWMDLVCWGHEHECLIDPEESLVGTFRITQPGSSVATSLTVGESKQKKVGILDIQGTQFRMRPIPLTQVRSFVLSDLSLQQQERLNPEDAKVEQKVQAILQDQVEVLIHNAKEEQEELWKAAKKGGNPLAINYDGHDHPETLPIANRLEKPGEVLVRLKVEHSGFSTLNNQRFGAKFIGHVANPTDILLFHRRKNMGESRKSSKTDKKLKEMAPLETDEADKIDIGELIDCEMEHDKKLDLLDGKGIAGALDEYVDKQQAQAINEAVAKQISRQQSRLIKRPPVGGTAATTSTPKKKNGRGKRATSEDEEDDLMEDATMKEPVPAKKRGTAATKKKATAAAASRKKKAVVEVDDDDMDFDEPTPKRGRKRAAAKTDLVVLDDSDDEEIDETPPKKAAARGRNARKATTKKKLTYVDSDDDDEEFDEVDDDDDEEEEPTPPPKKKRATTTKKTPAAATARGSRKKRSATPTDDDVSKLSQSQLSFVSVDKKKKAVNKKKSKYSMEDEDDSDGLGAATTSRSYEMDDDWGDLSTVKTATQRTK